ncbi:hypothetical protein Hanom_Chr16g01432421 [Helianthus anomalus]
MKIIMNMPITKLYIHTHIYIHTHTHLSKIYLGKPETINSNHSTNIFAYKTFFKLSELARCLIPFSLTKQQIEN